MNYLLITVLIALALFSFRSDKVSKPSFLQMAWIWLGCIPFTNATTAVLRAANRDDMSDMALVEIWSIGFQWLFLGLSILALAKAIVPSPEMPRATQRS